MGGRPELGLEPRHLCLHGFEITSGCTFISLFELAHPCVKHPIGYAQLLGHVNDDGMSFVDYLVDRLVLDLDGLLRSLRLLFSISVFDILICLLIWGNAKGPVIFMTLGVTEKRLCCCTQGHSG